MGIGAGIFLVALGAILTFAVNWKISGLDLHAVGWVLMIAGVVGVALFFVFWNNRRRPRTVVTNRQVYQDPAQPAVYHEPVQQQVYQERQVYQDPATPPPPGY